MRDKTFVPRDYDVFAGLDARVRAIQTFERAEGLTKSRANEG